MKCTERATDLAWPDGRSCLRDGMVIFAETHVGPFGAVGIVAAGGDGRDANDGEPALRCDTSPRWTIDSDGTWHLFEELPSAHLYESCGEQSGRLVWVKSPARQVRRRYPDDRAAVA